MDVDQDQAGVRVVWLAHTAATPAWTPAAADSSASPLPLPSDTSGHQRAGAAGSAPAAGSMSGSDL